MFIVVEPWPICCQVGWLLLISQSPTKPLLGFSHRMSDVRLPVKSPKPSMFTVDEPCPTTCQVGVPLFISQSPTVSLLGLNHNTSEMASPLKSPVGGGSFAKLPGKLTDVPPASAARTN